MQQIIAHVFQQNHESTYACLPAKGFNCSESKPIGLEWMVPVVNNGMLSTYQNVAIAEKPQNDAVKVIRILAAGQTMWIAVADDATLATFIDACNACCDAGTPTIPPPTIVGPFIEDEVCADDDGNSIYRAPVPTLIAGQRLYLELVSCNREALATPPADGFADAAALLAWASANLGDAGTFTIDTADSGDTLRLVSPECRSAMLQVGLLSQKWCGPVTFPVTYNKIISNGITTTLDASNVAANATELIAQIANYFDGQLTADIAGKIQYEGTGVPGKLQLNTTNKLVFALGECVA